MPAKIKNCTNMTFSQLYQGLDIDTQSALHNRKEIRSHGIDFYIKELRTGCMVGLTTNESSRHAHRTQAIRIVQNAIQIEYGDDMLLKVRTNTLMGVSILTIGVMKRLFTFIDDELNPVLEEEEDLGYTAGERFKSLFTNPHAAASADYKQFKQDQTCAIGLIKNGNSPLILSGIPEIDLPSKELFSKQIKHTNEFVACHDTADQLLSLLGTDEVLMNVQSRGLTDRRRAQGITQAIGLLQQKSCVVWVRVATQGGDGHSFVIVARPDGQYDVLEAWAVGAGDGSLGRLLDQCESNLSLANVEKYLKQMKSADRAKRLEGYNFFSTAYRGDPSHFEEGSVAHSLSAEADLQLTFKAVRLDTKANFKAKMQTRFNVLAELKREITLSQAEKDELERIKQQMREAHEAFNQRVR